MSQIDFINALNSLNINTTEKAQDLYAALCGTSWRYQNSPDRLFYSERTAGELVAGLTERIGYLSYYTSGREGSVAEWLHSGMEKFGWKHESSK